MKAIRKRKSFAGILLGVAALGTAFLVNTLSVYALEASLPTSEGSTLNNGYIYTVESSTTIQGSNGGDGLRVAPNANVTIKLSNDAVLTVMGGNGSSANNNDGSNGPGQGGSGGGAGIYLPSNSTLTIMGNGTVNVYGGSGGQGANGRGGWDGASEKYSHAGPSGAGGGGAGSGGAGIGIRGARGGNGGSTVWNEKSDGSSGNGGFGASGNAGTLRVLDTVRVNAYAGGSGGAGSGGSYGSRIKRGDYCGGGSGGGGGGLAGTSAAIGGAGGGGGGGGSGATTATFNSISEKRGATADPSRGESGSGGGSGGNGGGSFYKLVGSWGVKEDYRQKGGNGAGAGGGSRGGAIYCSSTASVNGAGGGSGNIDGRGSDLIPLYEITITVKLNNQPWSGCSVELYQNGIQKAVLKEKGTAYVTELFNKGVYNIFVDGIDTDYTITAGDISTHEPTVNYYDTAVKLLMEDEPWDGQSVALKRNGTIKYVMDNTNTDAAGNNYHRAEVLDNGEYEVIINNTFTAGKVEAGQRFDREYYEAKIDIKCDDNKWSDPVVVLKQRDGLASYTLQYKDGYYYWPIILKGTYDINVSKYYSGPTGNPDDQGQTGVTGESFTTTAKEPVDAAIDYYTVTFYDGDQQLDNKPELGMHARQRIVQKGKETKNPGVFNKVGYTFDSWRMIPTHGVLDDGELFFGESGSGGSTAVNKTMAVYAYFNTPGVYIDVYNKMTTTPGASYKLPNLRLSGYPKTGNPIQLVTITVTSGKIALESSTDVTATVTQDLKTAIITFTGGTDMKTAQDYLRTKVTITPFATNDEQKTEHKIDVKVFGSTNN